MKRCHGEKKNGKKEEKKEEWGGKCKSHWGGE